MSTPLYLTFGTADYHSKEHSEVVQTIDYGPIVIDVDVNWNAVGAEIFLRPGEKVVVEGQEEMLTDISLSRRRAYVWPDWSKVEGAEGD